MPILAFETHGNRKKHTNAVQREQVGLQNQARTELLVQGYFHGSSSNESYRFHPRRTLDQFSYYMLDQEEAEYRDKPSGSVSVGEWVGRTLKRSARS